MPSLTADRKVYTGNNSGREHLAETQIEKQTEISRFLYVQSTHANYQPLKYANTPKTPTSLSFSTSNSIVTYFVKVMEEKWDFNNHLYFLNDTKYLNM